MHDALNQVIFKGGDNKKYIFSVLKKIFVLIFFFPIHSVFSLNLSSNSKKMENSLKNLMRNLAFKEAQEKLFGFFFFT